MTSDPFAGDPSGAADSLDRLERLEFELAHLQRLYDQLNEVVTQQTRQVDRQAKQIEHLQTQLKEVKQKPASAEPFDPLEEKPPHY